MIFSLDELTGEQRKAVKELQMRVKDILDPNINGDISVFYRFLAARDFRINDAEIMLRKHIIWRKVYQVDSILEDFKPKECIFKYGTSSPIGFDKEGSLVLYVPSGNTNVKELYKCDRKQNIMRSVIWVLENYRSYIIKEHKKLGRKVLPQFTFILNLNHITFENITSKEMVEHSLKTMNATQDNYPEYMKALYVINAPGYYVLLYTILKTIMSNKTIMKIHIFGQSGWKEKLLEVIDADILPAFLGGKRTDSDGNPLCNSFINHSGAIHPKYFLSAEERYFKDRSIVKKVTVLHRKKEEIYLNVTATGTVIHWEFYCKSNIGFGLLREKAENILDEVIPVVKYDTSDGTEKYFHKSRYTGKYIIVFDNTSSWWSNKEVEYIIDVIKPEA